MKTNSTIQKPGTAPCPYLSIPLEVAQDPALSDGAILLFGEIYGIQRAYGRCFASDAHFQVRRGKGRSTIQRQITELCAKGHLLIFADGTKRRELRVAERYLGGKDREVLPENGIEGHRRPVDSCLENEAEFVVTHLINEKAAPARCRKNGTYKTPESKIKNQENKTTQSLSSGVVLDFQLSPDQEKVVKATVRLLDDEKNKAAYASLYVQASERGRLDAWEVAVTSTQKARLKSGNLSQPPIAYFRTVLRKCWEADKDYLRRQALKEAQGPFPAPVSRAHVDRADEFSEELDESNHDLGESNFDDEAFRDWNDDLGNEVDTLDHADGGGTRQRSDALFAAEAVGRKEYSVLCTPQPSVAAATDFNAAFSALSAERRESLVKRAEDEVRQRNPAFWLNAKGRKAGERLIQEQVREIVERENLISK